MMRTEGSTGGTEDVFIFRGLPLSWSEKDVWNALEAAGVTGIGLVQTLTGRQDISTNQCIIVRNGDAIVRFRKNFGTKFLNNLNWSPFKLSTENRLQAYVFEFNLTDQIQDDQLALLQTKFEGKGYTAFLQEDVFFEWHRGFMKAREETLQTNYDLNLSLSQHTYELLVEGQADEQLKEQPQLMLTLDPCSFGTRRIDLLRVDGPLPVFTFDAKDESKDIEIQAILSSTSTDNIQSSSSAFSEEEVSGEEEAAPETSGSESSSSEDVSENSSDLEMFVTLPASELHDAINVSEKATDIVEPAECSSTSHAVKPSVLHVNGLFHVMDATDVARFLEREVGGTLAFYARYVSKVTATKLGCKHTLEVPQRDAAIIFNDLEAEESCLEKEPFHWQFPLEPSSTRRISIRRMKSKQMIADVLKAFNAQKSVTDRLSLSEISLFDQDHIATIIESHEDVMHQKKILDTVQRDGFNIRVTEENVLKVESEWMKTWKPMYTNTLVASSSRSTPSVRSSVPESAETPVPIFVTGIYYYWDAGMVANYFAKELGCQVMFSVLYSKIVVGKKANGTDVRLRIPQGDGIIVLSTVAAQRQCLKMAKFYPEGLPPFPNGKKRFLKVRLVQGEVFLNSLADLISLHQKVQEGLNDSEHSSLRRLFQEMVERRHVSLLQDQLHFTRLREEQRVVFRVESRSICEHYKDWWLKQLVEKEERNAQKSSI